MQLEQHFAGQLMQRHASFLWACRLSKHTSQVLAGYGMLEAVGGRRHIQVGLCMYIYIQVTQSLHAP